MIEVNNHEADRELNVGGTPIALPHAAREYVILDETVVALLSGWSQGDVEFWEEMGMDMSHWKDPDFELDNSHRNVVAFDAHAALKWEIPEAPDDLPDDDGEPYYLSLWTADGDLWVRNKNRRAYRVDPDSGTLLENVPANHLRLGGKTIEFDHGWVGKVLHHDDVVAVMLETSDHPDPEGKNIYVYNSDGNELWWIGNHLQEGAPTSAPAFSNIWIDDGDLCGYAVDGYTYRFELETGILLDTEWTK